MLKLFKLGDCVTVRHDGEELKGKVVDWAGHGEGHIVLVELESGELHWFLDRRVNLAKRSSPDTLPATK